MASSDDSPNLEPVEEDIKDMKLKSGNSSEDEDEDKIAIGRRVRQEWLDSPAADTVKEKPLSQPQSPVERSKSIASLDGAEDGEETLVGGDVTIKHEPGQPPKLERKASQKMAARAPPLFDHYENKTEEARSTFEVLEQCTYASKALGSSGLEDEDNGCECAEEWDNATGTNSACDEDSDCINRATKMECLGDCGCGDKCQNQRFQLRQYANIAIIKTEKKGYGVRADKDLAPNQFIFEYIGEVINENQFRKRMLQYDDEGIKHFYFMSLSKGEFVDATRKGNLGRFCNHSCNPNCYVDKWVVGNKLRMGIFAERKIKAGEELVFNYNVDRYGADPQPCYCGEPNCTGFIGGKTQTERATKLSHATIEALGIDDGDGWDTTVAKRPRKKRAGEDDEEYVDSLQPRSLDEDGVTKVMASLMQNKEKWITVKLLGRIERCENLSVRSRVVRMKGYQILKTVLNEFKDDDNIVLQVLRILDSFPRVTRNKIADAKIEEVISQFTDHEDDRVADLAQGLLKGWASLEVAYRIPRVKRDPDAVRQRQQKRMEDERRQRRRRERTPERSRSRSPPKDAPKGPSNAPTGPKAQHAPFPRPFKFPRAPPGPLPQGWYTAKNDHGKTYYYDASGRTMWQRPTAPAPAIMPKPVPQENDLDKLINEITAQKAREADAKASAAATPQSAEKNGKKDKAEKKPRWMSYDEDKRKKLYQNTLSPHVSHVANKYKHKLPKDEVKRHFKDILKFMADSDFRKGRVEDPTSITEKQEKSVKKYTKDYLDKAVVKHKEYEKKKAAKLAVAKEKAVKEGKPVPTSAETPVKDEPQDHRKDDSDEDVVMELSDDEDIKAEISKTITPATPLDQLNGDTLKRKRRPDVDENGMEQASLETSPNKRARSITPPPPPPPPPPAEDMPGSAELTPTMSTPRNGWQDLQGQLDSPTGIVQSLPVSQTKLPQRFEEHLREEDEVDYGDDFQTEFSHSVQT